MRFLLSAGTLVAFVLCNTGCSGNSTSGETGLPHAALAAGTVASAGRLPQRLPSGRPLISGCTTSGTYSFVGNGLSNVAGGYQSAVLDGGANNACDFLSIVVGGDDNIIHSLTTSSGEFIGGGSANQISGASTYAFIGAGFGNSIAGGTHAVIAGGNLNQNSAFEGAIGGGGSNNVSAQWGTIGGGYGDTVSGPYGTLAGGYGNDVTAEFGAIGGGYGNHAGELAAVPGGKNNVAFGIGSFAGGIASTAGYQGDFVWSDDANGAKPLKAVTYNQFLVRASSGVTFYSSPGLASGVKLAAGSGTWASLSDRNAKGDILPVSDGDILAKVAELPITEWSYTTERGVRHVGPMAQDFYAAFNVGEDDRHITSIDEDGVALAAIKALNARSAQREAALSFKIAQKDAAIRALQHRDERFERELGALSAEVRAMRDSRR